MAKQAFLVRRCPNIRYVIGNGALIGDVVLIPQHQCLIRVTFTPNAYLCSPRLGIP
jgi:hypothetical protein